MGVRRARGSGQTRVFPDDPQGHRQRQKCLREQAKAGVARRGEDRARMVGLAQVTSTAQVRDTLAVTVAHSHSVMLVVHRGAS